MSRVCCDVTNHNLIPSRVIWGLVRDRNTTTLKSISNFITIKGVDRFPKSSCNLQLWKGSQFFLISAIPHFVATLRFPKHSRFSRSNYQNGMTDSYWTQWNAGQIGSKCLSNFFEQRWNPIHEGQHPKLQRWCGTLVWEPWPRQKICLNIYDARLVVYGCSEKLYIGCTVLILAILKRSANVAIPVLSWRTTQVVNFYGYLGFMVPTNCIGPF